MRVVKTLSLVATAAALAWSLGACSSGNQPGTTGAPSGTPATTAAATGPAPTSTTTPLPTRGDADLVIWADANRTKALQAPLAAWAAQNGIKAVVQTIATDLESNFVTANQAKNGPDIVIGAQDWTGKLVQNNSIVSIQLTATGIVQSAIDAVSYGGQTYGAPYAVETLGLFSNPKLTSVQTPATVEALVAAAKAGVNGTVAENPLCLQVGQTGDSYHMQPFFTSGGGYIFGKNADGTYNTKDVGVGAAGGIAAAKKIGELGQAGVLKTSITADNSIQLFGDSKCAYLISGPWAIQTIRTAKTDFNLAPVPGFEGMGPAKPPLGIQAFFVAANAKNPSYAQQFVSDLLKDTTITAAMNTVDSRVPVQTALADQLKSSDPQLMAFLDFSSAAEAMPNIPAMDAVWGPLNQAEASVVGGADPTSTFTAAGEQITKAIG
ncbi:MAG: extracellular solute-binding protein [Propionibacteriaceae bacterium]|jgi:arabinogalactan oligomer/maltooligosaccharide transport system substrate-binding protein|nr:extracellular solute-binding protein [Propionibacteriaceae bacterium]